MLIFLLACEPMSDPGPVFEPVPVSRPVADDPLQQVFETYDPQTVSSEALNGGDIAPGTAVGAAAPTGPMETAGSAPVTAAPVAPAVPEVVVAATPAPAATPSLPSFRGDPWPVRLVATIPGAVPPRAVLGLASGEEQVVSPGSMLAEQGLVIMSITGDSVQVARVKPAGDHAEIETVLLSAMYPRP